MSLSRMLSSSPSKKLKIGLYTRFNNSVRHETRFDCTLRDLRGHVVRGAETPFQDNLQGVVLLSVRNSVQVQNLDDVKILKTPSSSFLLA
jgi:hypothetical protein